SFSPRVSFKKCRRKFWKRLRLPARRPNKRRCAKRRSATTWRFCCEDFVKTISNYEFYAAGIVLRGAKDRSLACYENLDNVQPQSPDCFSVFVKLFLAALRRFGPIQCFPKRFCERCRQPGSVDWRECYRCGNQ